MERRYEELRHIENERLDKIQGGGALSAGVGIAIVAGVVFLIGVVDGFFRPLKCN